jgi:hypothetical protein
MYGSDWLPLSTDGLVVTMTAADCNGRWFDDSEIFTTQVLKSCHKVSQEKQQKNMVKVKVKVKLSLCLTN